MSKFEPTPYLIAEMACAHEGSVERACALIDAAAGAGVDAVQIQIYSTADLVVPQHHLYELLGRIELSPARWQEVTAHARRHRIDLLACVYDLPSLAVAERLGVDGLKLNSSDLSHPQMLAAAAASGMPFTLGTGASTWAEIDAALEVCRAHGARDLVLMHGVQDFPTAVEAARLQRVAALRTRYSLPVGYQDHTDAGDPFARVVDLVALGLGATVLEKHITLDRLERGIDHEAALEPDELSGWVSTVRTGWAVLGDDAVELTASDLRYRAFQKKNIVAARDIAEGQRIESEMLVFLRAGHGLLPTEAHTLVGRTAARGIRAFEPVELADVGD